MSIKDLEKIQGFLQMPNLDNSTRISLLMNCLDILLPILEDLYKEIAQKEDVINVDEIKEVKLINESQR